jgi:hypothetical protein
MNIRGTLEKIIKNRTSNFFQQYQSKTIAELVSINEIKFNFKM